MRKELLRDEEWLYSVVMFCGKSHDKVFKILPAVMELFENHLVSIGETGSILNINDYKRRFQSWWRCMKYRSSREILDYEQNREVPRPVCVQKPVSNAERIMSSADRVAAMAIKMLNQNESYDNIGR